MITARAAATQATRITGKPALLACLPSFFLNGYFRTPEPARRAVLSPPGPRST
jgi:hypothetical protein